MHPQLKSPSGAFVLVLFAIAGLELILQLSTEYISILVWASDYPYWTLGIVEIVGITLGTVFRGQRFFVQLVLTVWPAFLMASYFLGWAVWMCTYGGCPGHGLEFSFVVAAFMFFGGLFIANATALGIIRYAKKKIQEHRNAPSQPPNRF